MAHHTPHQERIIRRYYENRDAIMFEKISELTTELYLADTEKKRDRLWQRVAAAMKNLKIPESLVAHILEKRSPEVLAANLKNWMERLPSGRARSSAARSTRRTGLP